MTAETRIKVGFGLCITGLLIAALTLVPAIVPQTGLPWPIMVGSAIYFPGSALVFFSSKGQDRNIYFSRVRFIRLGFIAVMAIVMMRILQS